MTPPLLPVPSHPSQPTPPLRPGEVPDNRYLQHVLTTVTCSMIYFDLSLHSFSSPSNLKNEINKEPLSTTALTPIVGSCEEAVYNLGGRTLARRHSPPLTYVVAISQTFCNHHRPMLT
ncbi:hypothetical protein L1887_29238 [Cichorium endivia]|nr:hypothetical protein L1887_29238 [Cichorium endivia]